MWDLAVREDDYEAVDAMLRRFARAPLSYRIVPSYAKGDTAAINIQREALRNLDARQSQMAGRYVATHLEDFAAAEELARLDVAARRNAAIRLGAQTFLAWLEVARGKWGRASAAFDSAARMDGGHAVLTDRAIAATLPFLQVPRADLEEIRRTIDVWDPASEHAAGMGGGGLAVRLQPQLRLYLLGILSSRLGEDARALRYAEELERLPPPDQAVQVVHGLVATIRADAARSRGRHAEVLSLLQSANGQVPLELVWVKPFVNVREYTQEHARYLRAEALHALGRSDEARRWLETSFQGSPSELVYLAPMHERLAEIHARRGGGDRAVAAAHYRAFVRLWRDSDPALQTRVNGAVAAATRLESR